MGYVIKNTRDFRVALERDRMTALTDTQSRILAKTPLGKMIYFSLPSMGEVYIVPINRYHVRGMDMPTTEFRPATDAEMMYKSPTNPAPRGA